MELLQLRYFYECARSGSIVKTAEKYMVPASSVSASIRRLERELGAELFHRRANRISLNEQGERFKRSLGNMFAELDTAVADITCPTNDEKIKLLIYSNRSRITDYIIEYRNKHPEVSFEANINFDEADHTEYDIIVSVPEARFNGYDSFLFSDRRVSLQVGTGHPLVGKELTLKQLKDQPFVTMGGNLEKILVSACERAGFTPNIVARVNDIACYRKIIRSCIAIGHIRVSHDGPPIGYAYLTVADMDERQRTYVYFKKDRAFGNVKNFIEFLKTKCD